MIGSRIFRVAVPMMILGALALAGCKSMSAFSGTKVTLSGAEQVPPVSTSASGSGTILVNADKSLSGGITTTGLDGFAAHIHVGAPGQNGPVAVGLVKGDNGAWNLPSSARFTDDQYDAYKAGNTYVNVHTAANKGGEIRGQLKP